MSTYRNVEGTEWESFEEDGQWGVREVEHPEAGAVAGPFATEFEACSWMAQKLAGFDPDNLTPGDQPFVDATMLSLEKRKERETQRRKEAGRERALEELRALVPKICSDCMTGYSGPAELEDGEWWHGDDPGFECPAGPIHDRITVLEAEQP